MRVWAFALLLAACGAVPASADSATFIEAPVLLRRSNNSVTVVRCSIEVEGSARPTIVFLIDGTPSNQFPMVQCNSEYVLRYELEDSSVPRHCTGSNGNHIRHQALHVRTCSGDQSAYNPINIQCRVSSGVQALNTVFSPTMRLSYNQQQSPRLDLALTNETATFLSQPVCPEQGLGVLSLRSTLAPTTVPTPTTSQPTPQPSATPLPSISPTPAADALPGENDLLSRLSEGQLRLIIYVASGVAAFFAILVVCLVFVLCCIVMKKNRMKKAMPMRQRRRDVALVLGIGEDDKVVPVNNRDTGSEHQSSQESTTHQLALHRGSARSSCHSSSIRSTDGDEEEGLTRTSVEMRGDPEMVVAAPPSFPNPVSQSHETTAATEEVQDHDYDYIDEHHLPSRKEEGPALPARTGDRKKNTYIPDYETQPLHLCMSDTGPGTSDQFPTASFEASSMERSTLPPASLYQGQGTAIRRSTRKQQDYVNRPAHDYVNRPPPHDYVNAESPRGAVYHNSFMIGAQVHDYRNHQLPSGKAQTLVDMSTLTDSYQELNTAESACSVTVDPRISGYDVDYTGSSHLETLPTNLQRMEAHRRAMQDMGTSTCGSEVVYHTLYPSDGDSTLGSSSDCGIPHNATAMSTDNKVASAGRSDYDRLAAATSEGQADAQLRKVSAASSRTPSDYKDLEPTKMEGSSDYSTLKSTVTSASTQTYATAQ